MTTEPANDATLSLWYEHHVPALLAVEGFTWARRYRSASDPHHYLALYGIRDASDAPRLRPRRREDMLQPLAEEFLAFQERVRVTSARTVLFRQTDGYDFERWLFGLDDPIVVSEQAQTGGVGLRRLDDDGLDQDATPLRLSIAPVDGAAPAELVFRPLVKYWPSDGNHSAWRHETTH